jgi:hypothetical membrane protein
MERLRQWVVRLLVPSQVLFVLGFLVAGLLQPGAYSVRDDDISDLGALTAQHPWVELVPSFLAGAVTIAFGLLVLRTLVGGVGPWLLAGSLMGLDNVSDLFFRLDCGRAVAGCTESVRTDSWHAHVHEVVGLVTSIATVAALVALSHSFRRTPAWEDLATPALVFAAGFLGVMLTYAALAERPGGGLVQRVAVLLLMGAFSVLATRASSLVPART